MIIDFHVHIGKREHWHPWVNELFERANPDLYENFDDIMNPHGLEKFLHDQSVDRAVILAENSPITTGVVPNSYVEEFCKDVPMFLPFASIDPRTEAHPADNLRRLVEERGFKGLKLYPSYQQFRSNDELAYPLYETAEKLGIPVVVHTGSSVFKGARLKYANPQDLDDVAVDFPGLKLIMAHSGRGLWYNEAYFMARLHENVYMDVSGLPPKYLLRYFPDLEHVSDRVIFGSDWPGISSIRNNMDDINNLNLEPETKDKILGGNAAGILGLK